MVVLNQYPVLSIRAPPFSMITANSSLVIRGQSFLTQDATHSAEMFVSRQQ